MTDLPAPAYFVRIRPIYGDRYGYPSEELVLAPSGPIPAADPATSPDSKVQCVAAPKAPRKFSSKVEGAAVTLTWQPGAGEPAAGYVLQVGSAPGLQNILTAEFAATASWRERDRVQRRLRAQVGGDQHVRLELVGIGTHRLRRRRATPGCAPDSYTAGERRPGGVGVDGTNQWRACHPVPHRSGDARGAVRLRHSQARSGVQQRKHPSRSIHRHRSGWERDRVWPGFPASSGRRAVTPARSLQAPRPPPRTRRCFGTADFCHNAVPVGSLCASLHTPDNTVVIFRSFDRRKEFPSWQK